MLFKCATHAPAADHGHSHTVKSGRKHLTVDIHCHVHVPECDAMVDGKWTIEQIPVIHFASDLTRKLNVEQNEILMPKLTDPELRIADMDACGVDVQAISPSPFHYSYWAEPELGRDVARFANDRVAELGAKYPDRFAPMCTVPLQHPEMAVAELERCHDEHGMRAVEIGTNVEGKELTRAGLEKFFARVEELDMLIFMHPLGTTEGARMKDHYFTNLIGHPLESALAIGFLVFDGYLERYPDLKVCVAHGGGYLPGYWGRLDHPYPTREDVHGDLPHPPSYYLKKLHFDTVVFTELQLRHLIETWGADRIMMGTDYPYDMAEPDPVGHIDSVEGLSEDDKALVWGGNAARLLNLAVEPKA
ncbi:MAG: amidohydrolase family protein [Alphaproteobacteria bacterium]|nr:amidohydrolase family protein [Alphaproteobacteria bacterium]